MKIKQVYISDENFQRLSGINASALVNELLNEHFRKSEAKAMTPEERDLEIKRMEILLASAISRCPACGKETKDDFIICPACRKKLKKPCVQCEKPLNLEWKVCPFCKSEQ